MKLCLHPYLDYTYVFLSFYFCFLKHNTKVLPCFKSTFYRLNWLFQRIQNNDDNKR